MCSYSTHPLHGGGASLQGIRAENQDRHFVAVSEDGRRAVGAIADGIGGLEDGAGAATAAVDAVLAFAEWLFQVEVALPGEIAERVRDLYAAANAEIVERAGSASRSGTTLVLVAVTEEHLFIANVGDSRAWLLDEDGVHRLTEDHSVVEELVRDGALTPEQAERSPYRNLLTRSLGEGDAPKVDVYSAVDGYRALKAGAAVILSSDGVHGVAGGFDSENLQTALGRSGDLDKAAEEICGIAIEAGSKDNATLVVLRRA